MEDGRGKYGDRLLKRLEESVNTKGLNVTLFQILTDLFTSGIDCIIPVMNISISSF